MMKVPDNCTVDKFKGERGIQIQQWLENVKRQDREQEATTAKSVRTSLKPGKRNENKATAKNDNTEAAPKKRKISIVPM